MKTSNKILLAVLTLILLSIILILFIIKRNLKAESIVGNSFRTEQVRKVSHFNKIEVKNGIHVFYSQDTFTSVKIKADSNQIKYIKTEVSYDQLNIYFSRRIYSNTKIEVYVVSDSLHFLKLSAGCRFSSNKIIHSGTLEIIQDAGSFINMNGFFTNLNMNLNAGANAELEGTCMNLNLKANAGSGLKAKDLVIKNCSIDAIAGCSVSVNVTVELNVTANAGSIITYSGNPSLNTVDISSGARLKKE